MPGCRAGRSHWRDTPAPGTGPFPETRWRPSRACRNPHHCASATRRPPRAATSASPPPLQSRPLAAVREVDIVEPVVGEAHEVVARVERRKALLRQIRIRRVADLEAEMTLFEPRAGADLSPVAEFAP